MRIVVALAVVLAAAFSLAVAATSPALATASFERRTALEADVIRELNRVRGAQGLQSLRATPSLRTAARGHSQAMLEVGFFAHESADGTAFSERIRRHYTDRGWGLWSVGEALASGQRRVEASTIVAAWLDSPTHRTIILSPDWRDAGVGALYARAAPRAFGGRDAIVVTADFGLRTGRTPGL